MAGRTWSPVLTGEDARRAQRQLARLSARVQASDQSDPSLYNGSAGISLYFAELARARNDSSARTLATALLDRAVEGANALALEPQLGDGVAGLGFAMLHLGRTLADDGLAESAPGIDEALLGALRELPWDGQLDVVAGLAGIAVYLLERPSSPPAREALEVLLAHFERQAERTGDAVTWKTPIEELDGRLVTGCYNLGLAHGVPGIVAALAGMVEAGFERGRAGALLSGSVSWLLRQKLPAGADSLFPGSFGPGCEPRVSRAAWCYGDPGVALALAHAARAAGREDWEAEARAVALAVARRPAATTGVRDSHLCHGAAGLAHILNRLRVALGDAELEQAARGWFDRLLARHEAAADADLPILRDGQAFTAPPGIVNGAAGVALALLAATSDVEPAWDRMLLMS